MRTVLPRQRGAFAFLLAGGVLAVAALGGCSSSSNTPPPTYTEQPVGVLYNKAMDDIDHDDYDKAAKAFEEVERQHPYSVWATKAQLMGAYAQYERNKYDDAIVALDRFIQLHPGNPDTPYAYYLKGLCYYERITDVGRDQKMTEEALKTLQEVVDRFPDSKYAVDARMKVDLARDHLAGKEMSIARYYEKRHDYLAALNRFKTVVDQYQTTTHVPEALERMVEIYTALGMKDDARRTAAVLGHNFPGSPWYLDAYDLVKTGHSAEQASNPWYSWIPLLGDDTPGKASPPPHARLTTNAHPTTNAKPAKATKDGGGWFDRLW